MKIATWNLERLPKKKEAEILSQIQDINADILVLTETNTSINIPNYTAVFTKRLSKGFDGINYKEGEIRVGIYSKYKIIQSFKTYNDHTSLCVNIETPKGNLMIYGTIIGVFANKQPRFNDDLKGQIEDYYELLKNKNACIIGDFNTMFSGYAYPSHEARNILLEVFQNLDLNITTIDLENNVDHIVLSTKFLKDGKTEVQIWNQDKSLSDHIGVSIEF